MVQLVLQPFAADLRASEIADHRCLGFQLSAISLLIMLPGPFLQALLEVPGQEIFEVAESPRLLADSGPQQELL